MGAGANTFGAKQLNNQLNENNGNDTVSLERTNP